MFKFTPDPSFKLAVDISVPGADEPAILVLKAKYLSVPELEAWLKKRAGGKDIDAVIDVIDDWYDVMDTDGKEVPFNRQNFTHVLNKYHGSTVAILLKYINELRGARLKNS